MVLTTSKSIKSEQVVKETTALPIWWIKLTRWEYWPFHILYLPLYFYAAWLMLKARSFFFFSASNPGIENGGMLGESKARIFDQINARFKPETHLLDPGITLDELQQLLRQHHFQYPFILKPDIGERGWMVKKISNELQLKAYLEEIKVPFLLQELIDLPLELGIFYYRHPAKKKGKVTSIVLKEMMTVTGDGNSTVDDLLKANPRATITYKEIKKTSPHLLPYVPEKGEAVEVVPIGNHCRGTTFLNGNHLINKKIRRAIEQVALPFEGFYFGRFDLRAASLSELEQGNFKILELNGAGAEPAHIYQPGYPLLQAYRDLLHHLKVMYQIASYNHRQGTPYMSFREGVALIRFLRSYNRLKG